MEIQVSKKRGCYANEFARNAHVGAKSQRIFIDLLITTSWENYREGRISV